MGLMIEMLHSMFVFEVVLQRDSLKCDLSDSFKEIDPPQSEAYVAHHLPRQRSRIILLLLHFRVVIFLPTFSLGYIVPFACIFIRFYYCLLRF